MNSYSLIEQKIQAFIKKYYTSRLVKGVILFLAIGLLYFIATLLLEYFLWLSPLYRSILFWLFITVEIGLIYYFIGIPILKLTGLQKGISKEYASEIIGNHFPEVSDKLINLLQLKKENEASELLKASINQKSAALQNVPFKIAVNFKDNISYIKYLVVPIIIFLLFQLSGNQEVISSSYTRVMNPTIAYTPPAPFHFVIKNKDLQAVENKNYLLEVTTKGKVLPSEIKIHYNKQSYYLKKTDFNNFQYEFSSLKEPVSFYLEANNISSSSFTLNLVPTPSISNFLMELDYPSYINKKDEKISNTGNAIVPEGTIINWKLNTKSTNEVHFKERDSVVFFNKKEDLFTYSKQVNSSISYQLSTHNEYLKKYEELGYSIEVIKDQYPEINIQSKPDNLDKHTIYFLGKVSDDYGLTKLQLVYNEIGSSEKNKVIIPISKSNFDQFTYAFPTHLELKEGTSYEYYFQIFDNDAYHNYKSVKSETFCYNKLSNSELEQEQLQEQKETIKNLDKTLDKLEDQENKLKELNQINKEKSELNWNDKNKMKQFLQRQEKQEDLMKKFNKDLQKNLEDFQKENTENDPFKEQLQERLKNNEEEIEKNEKLLEELKKLQEKISQEDLAKKLKKLSKQNQNDQKSLEQIVELTKRYYVAKKFEKIANELEKLAKKQEELANKSGEENTKEKQDELNAAFEDIKKQLEELQKENNELKQPMPLDDQKKDQESISEDQKKASENLEKKQSNKAKQKQKSASEQMQQMSIKMKQQMQSSSREQLEEDVKMLRQIIDNLIHYSFDQESLLDKFKNINNTGLDYPNQLKRQYVLKENFQHIDDSLFALSLRQPRISELITKEVTDVHFNIDKALERFSDSKIYLGRSNQQYALTAANNLANMLSSMLDQMQQQLENNMPGMGQCDKPGGSGMPSPGQGKGEGFQLPDIIKKQEELLQEMKEGQEQSGKEGEQGQDGNSGKNGQSDNGKGNKNGTNGQGQDGEENSERLFEIYKQQQDLRNQLANIIKQNGEVNKYNHLLKEIDKLQDNLLEKGFNDEVVKQMEKLKHELLKLDKAAFEQGQETRRESNRNKNIFINTSQQSIPNIEQYFKEVEILNRQALPLQPIYKKKVKEYFNNVED